MRQAQQLAHLPAVRRDLVIARALAADHADADLIGWKDAGADDNEIAVVVLVVVATAAGVGVFFDAFICGRPNSTMFRSC